MSGQKMMRNAGMVKVRTGLVAGLMAGLAACTSQVPDSGAGFQDYNSYVRSRSTAPSSQPYAPAPVQMPQASTGFSTDSAAAAIAAAEGGSTATLPPTYQAPLDPTGQTTVAAGTTLPPIDAAACAGRGNAFAGIQETTSEMNYASGKVSDEQDFSAVTSRETIASDKERIECNREQYVVVQPGALPVRQGDEGPNIAAFALTTNNPPGVKLYNRPAFYLTSPVKACAKFASPDLAQQAFLAAGGPQRDGKALDPDGDGFACAWDPRPFRTAK